MDIIEFTQANGITESIQFDGQVHRYGKNKSGWYVAHDTGDFQVAIAGDFRSGEKNQWTSVETTKQTEKQREEIKKKAEEVRLQFKKEKEKRQAEAVKKAKWFLTKAVKKIPAEFEYLKKKNITKLYNTKFVRTEHEEFLAIPLYSTDETITSLQKIYSDGTKRFLSGGKIQGSRFDLNGDTETVYVTEGFATAVTIHEATGAMVSVAFNANNLEAIVRQLKPLYNKVVLCADNDAFKEMNTGLEAAKSISTKLGVEYVLPEFQNTESEPTDFNDLMTLEGVEAVKNQITNIQNNSVIIMGDEAIESLTTITKPELVALWESMGVGVTRQGQPIINESNILKVVAHDNTLGRGVFYDEFSQCILVKNKADKFETLTEYYVSSALVLLQTKYGLTKLSMSMCRSAIEHHAYANTIDLYKDFLNSLSWDGVERVEEFFTDTCGTPDSEYTRAISKNFWISMASRGLDPGCKVDNMVVLEGVQGVRKSSMLKIIGDEWFAENTAEIGDKDFYQNLQGVSLIEIAELDGFSKAGKNTIKRVLSSQEDKYRPSYGRYSIKAKRRCVFVGTTNDREYLDDSTGGRRFWPIKCSKINLLILQGNREQLYAEAVEMLKKGETWWEVPEIAAAIQENRRDEDPWESDILEWAENRTAFTTSGLLTECLFVKLDKQDRRLSLRVGRILRAHGFKSTLVYPNELSTDNNYQQQPSLNTRRKKAWVRT